MHRKFSRCLASTKYHAEHRDCTMLFRCDQSFKDLCNLSINNEYQAVSLNRNLHPTQHQPPIIFFWRFALTSWDSFSTSKERFMWITSPIGDWRRADGKFHQWSDVPMYSGCATIKKFWSNRIIGSKKVVIRVNKSVALLTFWEGFRSVY